MSEENEEIKQEAANRDERTNSVIEQIKKLNKLKYELKELKSTVNKGENKINKWRYWINILTWIYIVYSFHQL